MSVLEPPRGLAERLWSAQLNMGAETRAFLALRPSEGRLLAIAMLSGLIWYLGSLGALWLRQPIDLLPRDELLGRAGAEFAGALIWRTIGLYVVALLLWLGARIARGSGSAYATRAGFFWAVLVSAPALLISRLIAALPQLNLSAKVLVTALGLSIAAIFIAVAIKEVHGFRRAATVLLTMASIIAALAFLFKLLFSFQL